MTHGEKLPFPALLNVHAVNTVFFSPGRLPEFLSAMKVAEESYSGNEAANDEV